MASVVSPAADAIADVPVAVGHVWGSFSGQVTEDSGWWLSEYLDFGVDVSRIGPLCAGSPVMESWRTALWCGAAV